VDNRQFEKPEGLLGWVAGQIMAHRASNRARNRWTVDLLDVQPSDRVLELGSGPGIALEWVAAHATGGQVIGVDHSAAMVKRAMARNAEAIRAGRVVLQHGGLELLPTFTCQFDKVFSVNVFQFFADPKDALTVIGQIVKPGALVATTYMPRHRGASPQDADRFAEQLVRDMSDVGFHAVRTERLDLEPMPAVCVLGCA
jgi:SAM-dependent methyltransferase